MTVRTILLCLSAALVPTSPSGSAPAPVPAGGCTQTARALLQSSRAEAGARFWQRLGVGLDDPARSFRATLDEALRERAEALLLAEQQLAARLDVCALFGGAAYAPTLAPGAFSSTVDHPFFPLVQGRTLVYENHSERGLERVEMTTLDEEVLIRSVPCRAVEVVKTVDGELEERSTNWYSQHADGSVWWFGETTQHYDGGFLLNLNGSWRAGLAGAEPGILVPADLTIGVPFRRALAHGCSEDVARVLSLDATVGVPFGQFRGGLEIEEWDPLEPLELIIEILVPGLGLVAEIDTTSGSRLELVAIIDAPAQDRRSTRSR